MNSPSDAAAQDAGTLKTSEQEPATTAINLHGGITEPAPSPPQIKVGKRTALVGGKEAEVFTMTLGTETIELLPLRNWGQLDIYKWRVRGKLPGTPAGLEITFDHIKLLGQTVSTKDPEGCARLQTLFAEWLDLERENLELARKKTQSKAAAHTESASSAERVPPRFQVELDNKGMVHVHFVQGREQLASIGLNVAGFQSLVAQGFMRKPHSVKTGALHDWVELDGVLFSFEKGKNDGPRLEQALNHSYLPASGIGGGKEIVVYANAASSTGFDIQFPVKVAGSTENRRRPLTEDSLDLLQDPDHCGLLQAGLVVKLSRPTLIFKQKTPDGGERYFPQGPTNLVRVADEDGQETLVDLSQPVNYLHLGAVELTAVFNHPSINRHAQASPASSPRPNPSPSIPSHEPSRAASHDSLPALVPVATAVPGAVAPPTPSEAHSSMGSGLAAPGGVRADPSAAMPKVQRQELHKTELSEILSVADDTVNSTIPATEPKTRREQIRTPAVGSERGANLWLKPLVEQQPIRFDWLSCLIYEKIAARLHNSREGRLLGSKCWLVDLVQSEESDDSIPETARTCIFLAETGAFGFAGSGWLCRFETARATIGPEASQLKGEGVRLLALGLDAADRFVFVVSDGYPEKFGVAAQELETVLAGLREQGALLMSVKEVVESPDPLQVLWTVPVDQENPADPRALESVRNVVDPGAAHMN